MINPFYFVEMIIAKMRIYSCFVVLDLFVGKKKKKQYFDLYLNNKLGINKLRSYI